ncbi:peptidase family C54-domain-containing protein [Auriculariales sp. MPI-PUGE-AT-0066]|nr:peptidase family C54-domain-containing protein [Auriculariales sp. MPI-PUGE-AT-0066]
MSTSSTRSSPSPTTLASSPNGSRNLHKIFNRGSKDRSASGHDGGMGTSQGASASAPSDTTGTGSHGGRKGSGGSGKKSKLFASRAEREATADSLLVESPSAPTIVEPASPSTSNTSSDQSQTHGRARPRTERPHTADLSGYTSTGSNSRISDIPSRLSGWFSHTFTGSTTDLSLPGLLAQSAAVSQSVPSPKSKASGLLTAARTGKGHLDKAMRYLLDSDATPDKSNDPIWILGVAHPGWEAQPSPPPAPRPTLHRRNSTDSRSDSSRTHHPTHSASSSSSSSAHPGASLAVPPSSSTPAPLSPTKGAAAWPQAFYADYTSRVWLTYRSHFSPIHDCPLSACAGKDLESLDANPPKRSFWPGSGEKVWTSDAGWGCMLRTGQSLLANTLVHLHLGRDWRRPAISTATPDYATYVKILTWFFDSPSAHAPFSVHRMAMSGKDFGKDVGQWFGPSTAAGAIKTLVHDFSKAHLSVSIAVDGQLFESDVYAASNFPQKAADGPRKSGFKRPATAKWGDRAVLVLVAQRLGIEGVNPIYYENLKTIFTFPQSVGIAGGRPSSSYYFVGSQGSALFYLDPHHTRPTIPLRPPPAGDDEAPFPFPSTGASTTITGLPRSNSASSSSFSIPYGSNPAAQVSSPGLTGGRDQRSDRHSPPSVESGPPSSFRNRSATISPTTSTRSSSTQSQYEDAVQSPPTRRSSIGGDPLLAHYGLAYSSTDLRTFHCDRVRKMPLSGLDPSMLFGFLCKDEEDWKDFRRRMAEISKGRDTLFSIQAEPPKWPTDDDDIGMESMSEPDVDMPPEFDEEESVENHSQEIMESPTDEQDPGRPSFVDPEEPSTPLPSSRARRPYDSGAVPQGNDEDEDDEWMESEEDYAAAVQQPPQPQPQPQPQSQPQPQPQPANATITVHQHEWPTMKRPPPSGASTPTPNRVTGNSHTFPSGGSGSVQFPFPQSSADSPSTAEAPYDEYESKRTRRASLKSRTLDPAMLAKHQQQQQQQQQQQAMVHPGAQIPDYSQVRSIRMRNGGRTKSGGVKGVFPIDDRSDYSS